MKKSPCYGCEKRYSNCHSNCEEYKAYRAVIDATAKTVHEKRTEEWLVTDVKMSTISKIKKRNMKKYNHPWKGAKE